MIIGSKKLVEACRLSLYRLHASVHWVNFMLQQELLSADADVFQEIPLNFVIFTACSWQRTVSAINNFISVLFRPQTSQTSPHLGLLIVCKKSWGEGASSPGCRR